MRALGRLLRRLGKKLDLQDVVVFTGIGLLATAAGIIHVALALGVVGAFLTYLGLWHRGPRSSR